MDGLIWQQSQFIDESFRNCKPMEFVAYQWFDVVEFPASKNQFCSCVEDALQVSKLNRGQDRTDLRGQLLIW